MKQVLQAGNAGAVVRDVPSPPCPAGGVLVRNHFSVISSGTERSRVELSQKSLIGKARDRPDLVRDVVERARREGMRSTWAAVDRRLSEETAVGYSSAGVVAAVGGGVRGLKPGDRVACAGGGHANHAEMVSIPANLCTRVPEGVSMESAAFTTIAAIAMHAVRLSDVRLGERAAVIGCGLVGQITCRLLSCAGATVFALDLDERRVAQAVAGGADHGVLSDRSSVEQVMALSRDIGVDRVVVAAGAPDSAPLQLASEIARDRGVVILVGAVPIEFSRTPMYDKELSFRVSRSYGPGRYDREYEERGLDYPVGYVRWTEQRNMESVLDLQARGLLMLEDLIDEVVPVERAPEAYRRLVDSSGAPLLGAIAISFGAATRPERTPYERSSRMSTGPRVVSHAEYAASPAEDDSAAPVRPAARPSVSAPLRVGLIGPGSFASRVLVPNLVAAGAQLELVGGGSGPSAEAATRRLGFHRVAPSAAAVIADPEVDAVVISTRHGSHAQLVCDALRAGKHVYCEKPLALSHEQLDMVARAAAESPGIVAVGFNRRFSPALRRIREMVTRASGGPLICSYRVNAGRLSAGHWLHDLDEGGGRALGEGCHFVDSITYLVNAPVTRVFASSYGSPQLPLQAHDNLGVNLEFADGSVGLISYVADGSPKVPKERLEVSGRGSTAILDDYRDLRLWHGRERQRQRWRGQQKGHREEIESFVRGVSTGEPPVPFAEVENVSRATLAIVASLVTGEPIEVGRPV